jgi:hypothetical protein
LGNLKEQIETNQYLKEMMESLLQKYIFPELKSENAFLRARACWIYGQFGSFPFANPEHLQFSLNHIFENMQAGELPVRVSAAIAIKGLLEHEAAVNFLRPGLESLLRNYLKLMDEIEFDELVIALKTIVEAYDEEIAPFAVGLCQKLGEAYVRMLAIKGTDEEEDQETSLTADGLISAIRRVLDSIQDGNYKQLYPQLEEILDEPLRATFSDNGKMYVEEGISILSHLLYF